jgi:hypothetical protein
MTLLLILQLIVTLTNSENTFHSQVEDTTDMALIRSLFFNAPVDKFDSTCFNYFLKDTTFRHEMEENTWGVVSEDVEFSFHDFWFTRHPLFEGFDSGRVSFTFATRPDKVRMATIIMQFMFADTTGCKKAYQKATGLLEKMTTNAIKLNIEDYEHFTRFFISFNRIERYDGTMIYLVELTGN